MPSTTPLQGFRIPVGGDDPDVVDDMTQLALAIEKRVLGVYVSASDRNTKVTAPEDGQFAYLRDLKILTRYDAANAVWATYPAPTPTFSSGSTVPSNSVGSDGDVFYKV